MIRLSKPASSSKTPASLNWKAKVAFGELRRQNDAISSRIEINNSAVAAQTQGQQQAQFQQLFATVNALVPAVQGILQVAHATNQNVIAGNSGPVLTGPQTANPTNVNTR
jgi:hypothetical protein